MVVNLKMSDDDVFRSLETGRMSAAQVVECMRTTKSSALKSELDDEFRSHRVETVLKELETLVGLGKVKQTIAEIRAFIEVQRLRREVQLLSEPQVLHMIFKGNPFSPPVKQERLSIVFPR